MSAFFGHFLYFLLIDLITGLRFNFANFEDIYKLRIFLNENIITILHFFEPGSYPDES
jgi:hypothetical protein